MQINKNCFLLRGKLRCALYDLNNGCVYPVNSLQEMIIRTIAEGQRATSIPGYDDASVNRELEHLVSLKVVIAGRRKQTDVEFPAFDKPPKPNMLRHVWLELTNSCNLTCSHCYAGSSPKIKISDDLQFNKWKIILDKLLIKGVKRFTFIGGEPMIHFTLMNDIISYVHSVDRNIDLDIYTNLTLLADDSSWFSFLKEHKICFGTSLYGLTPEVHDEITRKKGSWNLTTKNIKLLVKNNFSVYVGYYYNENEKINKQEITGFIGSLGVRNFKIIAPAKIGRGEALDWRSDPDLNTIPKIKYFDADSLAENVFYHNCYKNVLTVKNDGSILPCIMTRDHPLTNLLTEDIESLENSSGYNEFMTMSKDKIDGCRECEFRYGCFDCRPEAFQKDKNLFSKSRCGYDPGLELQAHLI